MGRPQPAGRPGGIDDFLSHYGVPGMKWGRRKSEGTSAVKDRRGRPITKSADGESYTNSKGDRLANDAVKARVNQALAKQAGTDVLPTKDLQELVTRLNLEQQYSRLNPQTKSNGRAFIEGALTVAPPLVDAFASDNQYAQVAKLVLKSASTIAKNTK